MEKLPWWPLYGRDFFGDERVKLMTNAQIGMYVKMLDHQWNEGSVPVSIGLSAFMDLRNALHDSTLAEKEFSEVMSQCFVVHPKLARRVYNLKMDKVRRDQFKLQKENQRRGRIGGLVTQAKRRLKRPLERPLQSGLKPSSSAAQASQSQSQSQIKKKREGGNGHTPTPVIPIPDNWLPNESHTKLAAARGLDLPIEAAHFRGKAGELGWVTKDWHQKFTNWMLQEIKFRQRPRS